MKRKGYRLLVCLICLASVCLGDNRPHQVTSRNGMDRAVELLHNGIVFEAIHELERFVELEPDHEESRVLLARSLLQVKRPQRAAEEAAQALRINPENQYARRMLSRIRHEMGRTLNRQDFDAVLAFARLNAEPGSYDRASRYYRLALSLKDETHVHHEFARMLYWAGKYEESALHYEIFLMRNPSNAAAHAELGRVFNDVGDFGRAIASFERSLRLRPGHLDTTWGLVQAMIWSGKFDDAEDYLRRMTVRNMGGEIPWVFLASIARVQNRLLDEYKLLRQALHMNPDHKEANARLQELQDSVDMHIANMERQLSLDQTNTEVRRNLVDFYLKENRFGKAMEHIDTLLVRYPDSDELQSLRAWVRNEEQLRVFKQVSLFEDRFNRMHENEIHRLETWLTLNSGDMKSRERLADLYIMKGELPKAVEHLEWLAAAAPHITRVQQRLDQTKQRLRLTETVQAPNKESD